MKVTYCSSSYITISLGEEFNNVVIEANGEIMPQSEKFRIFSNTIEYLRAIRAEIRVTSGQGIA